MMLLLDNGILGLLDGGGACGLRNDEN
jgi:hypothetical protein